ncbi:hypothetical protein ABT173_25010 [Streptomyces sp. NPDC001795]|uniref:hypothetical protein n=1 Tax=unclassified Streptomyces TaxID=2593676 RepID=UPI0033301F66
MPTRTFIVTAAAVTAAVLAATGIITYASTAGSAEAAPVARRAAPPVQRAAPTVKRAAPAPVPAPVGGAAGKADERRGREGGDHGYGRRYEGRIYFNDRVFSAAIDGCVPAASGLGSNSFNIFNDSKEIVEVFRGFTCDNGAPVATVGPFGATNGVVTRTVSGGVFGDDGVVGSFRVVGHFDEW